ncbi:hypothetical protein NC652_000140 [Populus alba x Populus x berolinensis]|nr:hypothetical protein NC652_000140 [Populus alba x Populus x berolinensis]
MLPVVANPPPPEAAPPNPTPEATLSNPLHAAAPANPAPEDPKAANPPLIEATPANPPAVAALTKPPVELLVAKPPSKLLVESKPLPGDLNARGCDGNRGSVANLNAAGGFISTARLVMPQFYLAQSNLSVLHQEVVYWLIHQQYPSREKVYHQGHQEHLQHQHDH